MLPRIFSDVMRSGSFPFLFFFFFGRGRWESGERRGYMGGKGLSAHDVLEI